VALLSGSTGLKILEGAKARPRASLLSLVAKEKTMKIKMLVTKEGATDSSGTATKTYEEGKTYDVFEELAKVFLREKWAKKEAKQTQAEKGQNAPKAKNSTAS